MIPLVTYLAIWWCSLAQAVAGAAPSPPKRAVESAHSIDSLLADLESPECMVRDAAAILLSEKGPECYEPLRKLFHQTRFYEVRRQIRQITLEIYLSERFGPPRAFLGISHHGMPVGEAQDTRVPPWATALRITDVFKASSAQKAGLQSGDLVTAMNGRAATIEYPALEFTKWIAEQTPGTQCEVTVLRGGKGVKLVAHERSPFRPEALRTVTFEARSHADDPRVPPGVGGIVLTDITGVPIEIDVREGDLILALDEEALPVAAAAERFEKWRQGQWVGRGFPVDVGRLPPQAQLRLQPGQAVMVRTAQILRGGEALNIVVSLGRWPTYLADQMQGAPRAGGGGQREQVIESFGSWWRETFDPDGLFSERAEYDPDWQLKPTWKSR